MQDVYEASTISFYLRGIGARSLREEGVNYAFLKTLNLWLKLIAQNINQNMLMCNYGSSSGKPSS
jgi:hypothetical protein